MDAHALFNSACLLKLLCRHAGYKPVDRVVLSGKWTGPGVAVQHFNVVGQKGKVSSCGYQRAAELLRLIKPFYVRLFKLRRLFTAVSQHMEGESVADPVDREGLFQSALCIYWDQSWASEF